VRSLREFAQACGGVLVGTDRQFSGVSTDSRRIGRGELFIALRGPRFNGNEFVGAALAAGAAGAVVDAQNDTPLAQIVVGDTQAALMQAAAAARAGFAGTVVGVAGSNGKTTVKEMIAAILGEAGSTLATLGNLNNHIGVPLTLLRLTPAARFAVIEIGANHPGEVANLAQLARPEIGIVTNAGAEHLEGFGSLEGVARAEGELFAALPGDGVAVLNADDAFAALWRGMTAAPVSSFGFSDDADVRAEELSARLDADGLRTQFALIAPQGRTRVVLKLAGMHNVVNALGAAAVALAAGASLSQVAAGLARVEAVSGRLQFRARPDGVWIIDDSYNANPSSMRAALDVLAALGGRGWFVVGDMGELGDYAEQSHVELGELARERGVERLFATGPLSALSVEAFGKGAAWYPDADSLARAVSAELGDGVRVLVKGSRSNRLERVVDQLLFAPTAVSRDEPQRNERMDGH